MAAITLEFLVTGGPPFLIIEQDFVKASQRKNHGRHWSDTH